MALEVTFLVLLTITVSVDKASLDTGVGPDPVVMATRMANPHDGDSGRFLTAGTPAGQDITNGHSTTCSEDAGAAYPFTIVTVLIDLGREQWPSFRRPFETYLTYSIQMLQLEVPVVAYVDKKTEAFVRICRRGKEHLTRIQLVTMADFELYKDYARILKVMQSEEFKKDNLLLSHPEGFSPEYNILMNSKFALLRDTARVNPFNSSHFFWLDMGYGHGHDIYPRDNKWLPMALLRDTSHRITYIAINNLTQVRSIFDIYKKRVGPGVNGGFFGGTKKAVETYYHVHKHVFNEFLRVNMIDDDQTVAVECFLRYPELFNMVRGGWYDLFTLFL